ncbi:MAG: sigma 54-dependent Fis family transcriptional regulator [Labilithrix sp.]|nr:sigma 54-dependent Fis family transcriptional regulator [Labilithrix sp.]
MSDDFVDDETTRVPAESRGLRVPSVELVVVEGPERGRRVAIHAGSARIGTAEGCDLKLTDRTASRVHCELRVRPRAVLVRDAGSTNGTFCEGLRVVEAEVPAGATLRVGASAVRVEIGDEPAFVEVSSRTSFGDLVGASLDMRRLYAMLERVAPTDATVLVQGETGTGKDVVARSIHGASKRAGGPFVPIDCGAIPETLFESELFGHVRGAFSGALSDRKGVLEEADGGTLFLDEIGELPLALQAKLLRAIETRSVRRVGTNGVKPVDVRVIAATNRPLSRAVNEGLFREDLYYRLAVVEVQIPPLRARREDVATLATHFFHQLGGRGELPPSFAASLAQRSFPGNARELKNHVERAMMLGTIVPAVAAPSVATPPGLEELAPLHLPLKEAREKWTESFEQVYVRAALKRTRGNVTHAAEAAGVSRRFFQRLAARLGIKASDVGAAPEDLEPGDD